MNRNFSGTFVFVHPLSQSVSQSLASFFYISAHHCSWNGIVKLFLLVLPIIAKLYLLKKLTNGNIVCNAETFTVHVSICNESASVTGIAIDL